MGELREYEIRSEQGGTRLKPADIVKIAQAAEKEWLSTMEKPETIKQHIVGLLEAKMASIVAGVLGFDDHWGRWEVIHTNGRDPAIAQAIKKHCETTARDLVAAALQNYKPKADIAALIRREYESSLKESLREIAERLARENALQLVSETLSKPVTELQKAIASGIEDE